MANRNSKAKSTSKGSNSAKLPVIGSVCRCKKCNCEIKNDIGDGLCAECWSAN